MSYRKVDINKNCLVNCNLVFQTFYPKREEMKLGRMAENYKSISLLPSLSKVF